MAYIQVALDVPLPTLFDYAWPATVTGESATAEQIIGRRVIVPFGRRNVTGLAVSVSAASAFDAARIKPVREVLNDITPLPPAWLALMRFCAGYYQHPLGAAALSALPQGLKSGKTLDPLLSTRLAWQGAEPVWPKREHVKAAMAARLRAAAQGQAVAPGHAAAQGQAATPGAQATTEAAVAAPVYGCDLAGASPKALAYLAAWRLEGCVIEAAPPPFAVGDAPALNPEQVTAVEQITASINDRDGAGSYRAHLLHGVTGSGKTEVYLRAAAAALARGRQVLLLVPEINLTPRLMQSVRARFPSSTIVALHSELNESERLHGWLLAHAGEASIVLGTRLAVLASLPRLGLIVVDEEHDPSFKQQEGMRYSARDLAVFRAHQENLPIVLGSATPSLETYAHAESGRYARLRLGRRAVANSVLPRVRLIDLNTAPLEHGVSAAVRDAVQQRLGAGEQSLVFLNRRGFAPVLSCAGCGWVSACTRCTSYLVLHRHGSANKLQSDGMLSSGHLVCHHCGFDTAVPERCPTCGNLDIRAYGQGTQRLESRLSEAFPGARILRIDRDATARKGSAERLFAQAHGTEVDILVGTQMLAKGHDFKRLTLVAALNVDAALFSADFRAGERLFAQLMQVAGRAGRTEKPGEVLIQTRNGGHPLFQALMDHDYDRFARNLLKERQQASLPPAAYQAMLRAEAATLAHALEFLHQAAAQGEDAAGIMMYDPVPMVVTRLMNAERAQLMVESSSRPALQAFLTGWSAWLYANAPRSVRWHLEVDPLEI